MHKEESKREAHTESKQQISGLPEMPIRQKKIKQTMKAIVSVSNKSFDTYKTAMDELKKHKRVEERLQTLEEEDEGVDTIFVNPAVDFGEEGTSETFDPLTDYEQRIRLMSEESTQSYDALLLELSSKMSSSEHKSTSTTDHAPGDNTTAVNTTAFEDGKSSQTAMLQKNSSTETSVDKRKGFANPLAVPQDDSTLPGDVFEEDLSGSNATPKVALIEQTATKETSQAGALPSAQSVGMHVDKEAFNVWYNTNPETFSLQLSGDEPMVERIEVTKL